ncbi:insulinase family protein [Thalassotalea litorea]|uniref:Insulinase family protein n=2 Tax=Thalassotalea litorea TaxID=2020715 RepID=A0A5R9IGQ9_9GAMM|nr:insulinase family protein [Thalassotalea litorea]
MFGTLSAQEHTATSLAQMAEPLYQWESRIQYQTLNNGLQLRLLPLPDSQSVSIASQFAVGSRDEGSNERGYAHLFEHMLFKGSEQAPGETYLQTIGAYAGRFNATTWFDYTNYFLTLPAEALELGLVLEADRFQRPVLTAASVNSEIDTVLQEMAQSVDMQPYARPAMEHLLTLVAGTSYGHPVIGVREDLLAATPKNLVQFHRQHYRPETMQLSLVGALHSDTLTWVEREFAFWQNTTPAPIRDNQPLTIERGDHHGSVTDTRGPWPVLLLGWHTVPSNHKDAAAIALLERYLVQDSASLIKQTRLSDPDQLMVISYPLRLELHGVTALALVPRARASLDRLANNVKVLIDDLAQTPMSETQLNRLKNNWLNEQLSLLNDPQALAVTMSATSNQDTLTPLTGPWARIKEVTPEQVQRVAQDYFKAGTVRLDLLPPWYKRWGKHVLEWLPDSWADSLEEKLL